MGGIESFQQFLHWEKTPPWSPSGDSKRAAVRKDEICYYPEAAVKEVYKSETGWIRSER
jgi:hypothetical protein